MFAVLPTLGNSLGPYTLAVGHWHSPGKENRPQKENVSNLNWNPNQNVLK